MGLFNKKEKGMVQVSFTEEDCYRLAWLIHMAERKGRRFDTRALD